MNKTVRSGFTLIELLVVIAVIGVLAGAIIVMINPPLQLARARDIKRKNDIRVIQNALENYLTVNGSYPDTGGMGSTSWVYSTAGGIWIPGLAPNYINAIPKDPKNIAIAGGPWSTTSDNYIYAYASNGVHYNLVALLEDKLDPDRCEIKHGFFITNGNGSGAPWCPNASYSNYIYTTTDLNK